MTSISAHDSNKTLQIALVGVRPADQVMLKGYMRVILRLETGLEWVSANHPTVDFYIINQEFAHADSVKKLLTTHPKAAVLYVQRDDNHGGVSDNILTLPLKELDQLKYWLSQHIESLRDDTVAPPQAALSQATTPSTSPTPIPPAMQSRMTLDEIIASRAQGPASTSPNPFNEPQPLVNSSQVSISDDDSLLALFRQLHATTDGLLTLTNHGEIMAYVDPSRQRIWLVKDIPIFTPDLKVIAPIHPPILVNYPSKDLVQWLWEKAFDMPMTSISQLAKDNISYHLTSWVKPHRAEYSHDILKIQSVLEAKEATLAQVIQITQTTHDITRRTIAALTAAGVMPAAVYTQLKNTHSPNSVLGTTPTHVEIVPSSGTSTPIPPTNPNPIPSDPTQPVAKTDDGMRGFLSKLRRKLGL